MALIDLEDKIVKIIESIDHDNFIFEFLRVYDIPNATVTKLKNGINNLSKNPSEIHLKNKLFYKMVEENIFNCFEKVEMKFEEVVSKPRYIIVTDFKTILTKDTKTKETLAIDFKDLPLHFDFFLAWNGIEKVDYEKENPLDIKAAERFARLYDVLNKEIDSKDEGNRHALNLFLMRLLFCLFAEDTGIFQKGQFTDGIKKYTDKDASNLNKYIHGLFKVLDEPTREKVDTIYKHFPYVNGQLFSESHKDIKFNEKSRKLMIECGELLEWSKINPDIFGSMIQAVATEENRHYLGMHYTSVPNIMKVINPLFLEDIRNQFKEIEESWNGSFQVKSLGKKKINIIRNRHLAQLTALSKRIRGIKFFDPACGSGNFLIITYKELRKLEIDIYVLMNEISDAQMLIYEPIVTLSQFFGIEIDDFASEIAKLSLWIAEHQMNMELKAAITEAIRPTLPLKSAGDICCTNALHVEWKEICPYNMNEEVYIFGNPPYLGSKKQLDAQKKDMKLLFGGTKNYKQLDYISAWFKKGSCYIEGSNAQLAFVTVDSITQGEQIFILWNELYKYHVDISFAYKAFKWSNNAKKSAGVIVQIIGLKDKGNKSDKYIFASNQKLKVDYINPYLTEGEVPLVEKSNKVLFQGLPKMSFGNMPNGKDLILKESEYKKIIDKYPSSGIYFRKFVGSDEFLKGKYRYCLWLTSESYNEAKNIPEIYERIEKVKLSRLASEDKGANRLAETPYKFRDTNEAKKFSLIVPSVSSENRYYIPMGFIDKSIVASNLVNVIYDAPIYMLGVLMSRMHMVWSKAVGGKKGSSYRYTIGVCYNTFPFRKLSKTEENSIEKLVLEILDVREEDGRVLAEMYMPATMTDRLKELHEELDEKVDKIYSKKPFKSDNERLSHLLNLYAKRLKQKK